MKNDDFEKKVKKIDGWVVQIFVCIAASLIATLWLLNVLGII